MKEMPNILWLEEIKKEDITSVGGKGASLGEMASLGLPVPKAFVVTAQAFRRFLVETGIEDAIFRKLERLDVDDNDALESVSREVQDLVLSAEIPDYIKEDIVDAYAQMGANEVVVAVRSSATAEDLPEASFAGQQETFLNVLGNDDLLDAVQRCWASLYGARAIYYRAKQGFDDRGVNIAVVVQELIRSEKSGVMFTSHPVTGEPLTIIEASWGLGEAVVSGSVSPDNYVFDLRSGRVVDRLIAEKEIMIVPGAMTGQRSSNSPPKSAPPRSSRTQRWRASQRLERSWRIITVSHRMLNGQLSATRSLFSSPDPSRPSGGRRSPARVQNPRRKLRAHSVWCCWKARALPPG